MPHQRAKASSKRVMYCPSEEIQLVSRQSRTYRSSLPSKTGSHTGIMSKRLSEPVRVSERRRRRKGRRVGADPEPRRPIRDEGGSRRTHWREGTPAGPLSEPRAPAPSAASRDGRAPQPERG